MMLVKLLSGLDRSEFECAVVSLMDEGTLGGRIRELGIEVMCLGMKRGASFPQAIARLRRAATAFRPDVVQGWMYHGNLAASTLRRLGFGRTPIIWNVRQSLYGLDLEKRGTAWVIRAGAWLSRTPAAIIYNSRLGAEQHEAIGFDVAHRQLIPNGFDVARFRPDPEARMRVREELGIASSDVVIGLIARYHPMKDHRNFLWAAALLEKSRPGARYVLAGRGVDRNNPEFADTLDELSLWDRVLLLGERSDVPALMAAFDIACLTSAWGEGFPNVIGEAMACGVPIAATEVGDSGWIVGDTGRVVPPREPALLARAWEELIALGPEVRAMLGARARERVVAEFSLEHVIAQYGELYRAVLAGRAVPCAA